MPDNRKPLIYGAFPVCRNYTVRAYQQLDLHQLTGDFYTVGEVLGHTLAGIGASLGLSMNFEAVTARYVDVRLERKRRCWTPTTAQ